MVILLHILPQLFSGTHYYSWDGSGIKTSEWFLVQTQLAASVQLITNNLSVNTHSDSMGGKDSSLSRLLSSSQQQLEQDHKMAEIHSLERSYCTLSLPRSTASTPSISLRRESFAIQYVPKSKSAVNVQRPWELIDAGRQQLVYYSTQLHLKRYWYILSVTYMEGNWSTLSLKVVLVGHPSSCRCKISMKIRHNYMMCSL